MQLRPPVHRALHEPRRLKDLEDAVIVEVGELGVPGPPASRQSQRLTAVHVGRHARAHEARGTRAKECKMAFFERVFARDVADEDIEPSVAIEVAEVDPHSFE